MLLGDPPPRRLRPRLANALGREFALVAIPSALLLLAVFYAAYRVVDPLPPRKLVMAAGTQETSYRYFAQRYRSLLARDGIELEIRFSEGAFENLALLRDRASGVSAGFTTSGVTPLSDAKTLVALGGAYYTPLWIFYRSNETLARFSQLQGKRVSIGTPGGTVKQLVNEILAASGALPSTTVVELAGARALDALVAGEIDAMLFPGTFDGDVVRRALASPEIRIMNVEQAEAIARKVPAFTHVVLPRGLIDLGNNKPAGDVHMLATVNSVLVRSDLHPALQYLLLKAMKEVHSPPGPFNRYGEFPAPHPQDPPLSPTAERFYRSGPPLLHQYMSFWLAVLLDHAIFILVPIVATLIPILGFAPAIYRWLNRRPIWRWYETVARLEHDIDADAGGERVDQHCARLVEIERGVRMLKVSVAFASEVYELRQHLRLLRDKLAGEQALRRPLAREPMGG
jgi:TRAP-type uncharacterized transport system substrate-binding protein